MNEGMIGNKYGRWTVIGVTGDNKRLRCRCECGVEKDVIKKNLKSGDSMSCGCYSLDMLKKRSTKHGGKHSRIYNVWCNMRCRCNNEKDPRYNRYGGRGITVCDEWNDFSNFRNWMLSQGYDETLPYGVQTIDRIDNNREYSPQNCRLATIKQQNANRYNRRELEYNGITLSITEWDKKMGYKKGVVGYRIRSGWSVEKAITTPVRRKRA